MRPRIEPIDLPRGLIFVAAIWLIGSWFASMGVHRPVYASSASYAPGVRLMLLSILIGLMVAWPMLRLSQRPTQHAIGQTLLDLFVLLSLVQVIIWMLRLVTPWSPMRMAAIDAVVCGWAVLAGAIVASSIGSRTPGVRWFAMALCLIMLLGGWMFFGLGVNPEFADFALLARGPILGVLDLTEPGRLLTGRPIWWAIATLAAAGVVAWAALGVIAAFRPTDSGTDASTAVG